MVPCLSVVKNEDILRATTGMVRDPAAGKQSTAPVRIAGRCTSSGCVFRLRAARQAETSTHSIADLERSIQEVQAKLQQRDVSPGKARHDTIPRPGITRAIGPTGTRYEFEYRVVEADQLLTSHDPFSFAVNPRYVQTLQPRLRDRAATQLQVLQMAEQLDPDLLLTDFQAIDRGTPIVGPDMLVESGNGRVMALRRAIVDHPERYQRYKDRLIDLAREEQSLGLDPNQIGRMRHPVLVRVRLTEVDRVAFAREANMPPGIAQSAVERARVDAQNITVDMLQDLVVGENQSIEQALRSPANSAFIRRFLSTVPPNELGALVDAKGQLSQDGLRRMVLALFVAAFPGDVGLRLAERFFESTDEVVRNTFNGITMALGPLAKAESLVRQGRRHQTLSIGEDLAKAVTVLARIKSEPDMTVEKYLAQTQLFERELNPFQEDLLRTLAERTRSGKRIGAMLKQYARLVIESPPPEQGAMFGGPSLDKAALLATAIRLADEPQIALVADSLSGRRRARLHLAMHPAVRRRLAAFKPLAELLLDNTKGRNGATAWVYQGLTPDAIVITVANHPDVVSLARRVRQTLGHMARLVRSATRGEIAMEIVLPRR